MKHSAIELPFLISAFQGAHTGLAVSDRQGFTEGSLVTQPCLRRRELWESDSAGTGVERYERHEGCEGCAVCLLHAHITSTPWCRVVGWLGLVPKAM